MVSNSGKLLLNPVPFYLCVHFTLTPKRSVLAESDWRIIDFLIDFLYLFLLHQICVNV